MPQYGQAISDPALLSQLNQGQENNSPVRYGNVINDPNLLSQLNGTRSSAVSPFDRNPDDTVNTFLGKMPADIPSLDSGTPENKAMIGEMLGVALGGPGKVMLSGLKNEYNSLKNWAFPQAPQLSENVMSTPYKPTSTWGSMENTEFSNTPIPLPASLTQEVTSASPEDHAQSLMQNISKGERPEEAGQNLAANIKSTYANVKSKAQIPYNDIFDKTTVDGNTVGDAPIFQHPDPLTGVQRQGDYADLIGNRKNPFNDSNLDALHKDLIKNPSIDNAHALQSDLGGEIAYMQKQRDMGNLDDSGISKLNFYTSARQALFNDAGNALDKIQPGLSDEYNAATQNWKNEVIPYHTDKDLRDIAQGKIQNPTTTQINGIFKNPESQMNKVVNDLGQDSKDRIAYLGMGKLPEENSPSQLMNAKTSLEKKGLNSYLSPELHQSFSELNDKINGATQAAQQNVTNAQAVQNIQSQLPLNRSVNQIQSARQAQSESGYQNAIADSKRLQEAAKQKINELLAAQHKTPGNALRTIYKVGKKVTTGL